MVSLLGILMGQHLMSAGQRLRGLPWYAVGAVAVVLAAWIPVSGRPIPAPIDRALTRLTGSRMTMPALTAGAIGCGLLTYRLAYGQTLFDSVWNVALAWFAGFMFLALIAARPGE
ncbi:MAG: hypothetical protein QM753_10275 [Thermomicrobiales bacterium]